MSRKQIEQLMGLTWQMEGLHERIVTGKRNGSPLWRGLQDEYDRMKVTRDELYERVMRGIGEML